VTIPPAGEAAKGTAQASVPPTVHRIVPAAMNQMTRRLNPTMEQRKKIAPLIARAAEDIQRLDREHWQDSTRVTDRMYQDIAALLTPEQQIQLENMRQETLERVRRAREKQREDAQAKSSAARQNSKPLTPEGANPGR
jgi:hypothetical protein